MTNHRTSIRKALIGAGLLLVVTLILVSVKQAGLIGSDAVERGLGVMLGLSLIIIGNNLPKTLDPPTEEQCRPSRKQALQRFSGWVFVIMGLGYSLVWLILPVEQAVTVGILIVAPAVVLVCGRTLWIYFTCKRVQPKAEV